MNPGWFAVLGALAAGVPQLLTVVVQTVGARGQRAHDAEQARLQREAEAAELQAAREHEASERRREQAAALLGDRRAIVADWREKLHMAHIEYEAWTELNNAIVPAPNLAGREWFEELRPHLTGKAEEALRNAHTVRCNHSVHIALSLEIGRIEEAWIAETLG